MNDRLWMSIYGEDALAEDDLPACCRRAAVEHASKNEPSPFECPICGAMWYPYVAGSEAREPSEAGKKEEE